MRRKRLDKRRFSWRHVLAFVATVCFVVGYGTAVVNVQPSTPDWVRYSVYFLGVSVIFTFFAGVRFPQNDN
jgi:hypothetical protein